MYIAYICGMCMHICVYGGMCTSCICVFYVVCMCRYEVCGKICLYMCTGICSICIVDVCIYVCTVVFIHIGVVYSVFCVYIGV